jgi:hypothetical protein
MADTELMTEPIDRNATQLRRLRFRVHVLEAFMAGVVVFIVLLTVLIARETAALHSLQNGSPPHRPAAPALSTCLGLHAIAPDMRCAAEEPGETGPPLIVGIARTASASQP